MAVECTIPERVISIKELTMRFVYNVGLADDMELLAQINNELDMIKSEANMMRYKLQLVADMAEKKN